MYHRLFRKQDFDQCVPLLPRGYAISGKLRAALPALWRRLFAEGQLHGGVVVPSPRRQLILAFGMFVFLGDDFVVEMLRSPVPYVSSAVYARILSHRSPLLSTSEIRAANTAGRLNLLILHFGMGRATVDDGQQRAIAVAAQTGFRLCSMGYRLSRVLQEAYGSAELPFFTSAGFVLKSDYAAFYARQPHHVPPPDRRPHLMGLFSTDPECRYPGNALADHFQAAPPPQIRFSGAEQRVLLHSIMDESDETIANSLGVSLDAVKKTWRRIHQRVTLRAPHLLDDGGDIGPVRGKERRRQLIQYLRYHPAELRPFGKGP
jgi:hypothetical protein